MPTVDGGTRRAGGDSMNSTASRPSVADGVPPYWASHGLRRSITWAEKGAKIEGDINNSHVEAAESPGDVT